MRRYIAALILSLILMLGCFGFGGYKAWEILGEQAGASAPEVLAAQKAAFEADLAAISLDPNTAVRWQTEAFVWPKTASVFFALPQGFTEKNRYVTPEGFPILSDSGSWKPDSLKKVYEELIKIKHGTEIGKLDAVFLCSKAVKFKDDAEGEFVIDKRQAKLSFRLPGLLATPSVFAYQTTSSTIWIREPKKGDGVRQLGYVISHEYGHFFHFVYNAGQDAAIERTFTDAQKKLLGSAYIWQREEIEANDFATLMGSPGCYEKAALPDVKQELAARIKSGKLKKGEYQRQYSQIFDMLNPLALTMLKPASQVKGLADAYYSLLPNPPTSPRIPTKLPKLSIAGADGTYTVSWTLPWTDKKTYYVLLCSSDEVDKTLKGTPFEGSKWYEFVCSRWGNEKGSATVGKATQRKGNTVYWLDDGIAKGTKTFRVFAVLPDNTVVVSEPLRYKFK